MQQNEIMADCLRKLKDEIVSQQSDEIVVILFDDIIDGKVYEFEIKATEKKLAESKLELFEKQ